MTGGSESGPPLGPYDSGLSSGRDSSGNGDARGPEGYGYGQYSQYGNTGRGFAWSDAIALVRRHAWVVLLGCGLGTAVGYWRSRNDVPLYEAVAVLRVSERAATGGLNALSPVTAINSLQTELELLRSGSMARIVADSMGPAVQTRRSVRAVLASSSLSLDVASVTVGLRFSEDGYGVLEDSTEGSNLVPYGEPLELPSARVTVDARPQGVDEAEVQLLSPDALAEQVRGGLRARVRGGTEVVEIAFNSPDPEFAAEVVNTTARAWEEQTKVNARRDARARLDFLEAQLARADSAFTEARGELETFQRETGLLPSQARLTQWRENMLNAEAELANLRSDKRTVTSIVGRMEIKTGSDEELQTLVYAPVISDNAMVQRLYSQYQELKDERETLTAGRFGAADGSPEVQRVDSLMSRTRREIVMAASTLVRILDEQIALAQESVDQARDLVGELPDEAEEEAELVQRVSASRGVVEELRNEILRAQIAEALEGGFVDIVDAATVPTSPIQRRGLPKMALGFLLGLALGIGAAVGLDRMDVTIKSREDLELSLGLPSLAAIPRAASGPRAKLGRFPYFFSSRDTARPRALLGSGGEGGEASSIQEAFKSLRTNLLFAGRLNDLRTLVVTSAMPSEGKTTTSVNLAIAFGQQGRRTLLIDADLRRPRVHEFFKMRSVPGLTDLLVATERRDLIQQTELPDLFVLPGGRAAYHPAETLGSSRFRALLQELARPFDLVILDTPPVLPFTDAAVVASAADGVLVVVSAGETDRRVSQAAISQLQSVGAKIVGTVLNGYDQRQGMSYGVYYAPGYGEREAEGPELI